MDRLLLTVALVLVCVLAAAGLWWGWRNRLRRQTETLGVPGLAAVPADLGVDLAEPLAGLYVSTTVSGHWQDRLLVNDLGRRARADVFLTERGVLIDRVGEESIFIPAADLVGVGTAPGIAGKVMGMPDGILVLTWNLGAVAVDTGVRADDLAQQDDWIAAAQQLTTNDGVST